MPRVQTHSGLGAWMRPVGTPPARQGWRRPASAISKRDIKRSRLRCPVSPYCDDTQFLAGIRRRQVLGFEPCCSPPGNSTTSSNSALVQRAACPWPRRRPSTRSRANWNYALPTLPLHGSRPSQLESLSCPGEAPSRPIFPSKAVGATRMPRVPTSSLSIEPTPASPRHEGILHQ
jgi:hypothetical protein